MRKKRKERYCNLSVRFTGVTSGGLKHASDQ
jgi:hypothetical protein